jgi:hypothetical protein
MRHLHLPDVNLSRSRHIGWHTPLSSGMNAEYRVLKIDRTHSDTLDLTDDGVRYTQKVRTIDFSLFDVFANHHEQTPLTSSDL